jgi:hypothetical protein
VTVVNSTNQGNVVSSGVVMTRSVGVGFGVCVQPVTKVIANTEHQNAVHLGDGRVRVHMYETVRESHLPAVIA